MGVQGYMKRVVSYLKEKNIINETTDQCLIPKNINDLENILKSSDWYQSNLTENRSIFFHIMYGLFLKGQDDWPQEIIVQRIGKTLFM